jgi:uncharacterized protein with HEPN domain
MKTSRLVQDYHQDIIEAMTKAEVFVDGLDLNAFRKDEKTLFAVIRALEIVGEAAKKVPVHLRRRFASIPWKNLAGIRDKLVHDYVGVSAEVVWRTVKEDIPAVRPAIADMLREIRLKEDSGESQTP